MSSLNLNKVVLCGRLTADPELKQTTQNNINVVSFSLAVNRRYSSRNENGQQQQTTDFINVVAWRNTAEFISKYFKKGSAICITGSLQSRRWTDQQGQTRSTLEVIVDEAMFVDSRNDSAARDDSQSGFVPSSYTSGSQNLASGNGNVNFEDVKSDEDFPF
ncbi:MAG: single-stranded DNA-binding protein [Clostridia bacterium]|nr:single-stranded DNA-binding protein [Clostridia bacterium]